MGCDRPSGKNGVEMDSRHEEFVRRVEEYTAGRFRSAFRGANRPATADRADPGRSWPIGPRNWSGRRFRDPWTSPGYRRRQDYEGRLPEARPPSSSATSSLSIPAGESRRPSFARELTAADTEVPSREALVTISRP